MLVLNETIAAVATPRGTGGIAIVRVSGGFACQIMQALLGKQLTPREATHLPFLGDNDEILDEGIAIYFKAPHSFTGEDVLELHGHGGPIVVDRLLHRILELGARLARPGEFSERAFLNDKMDLAQAEAVADLINATSEQAAKLAMRSLQGEFSSAIHRLNERITYLRMMVEAGIDFSDEAIESLSDVELKNKLNDIHAELASILSNAMQGSLLRDGITAVIAGEPNVGKSSLLNALSGKPLAIVTDIPGTTRDVLRDQINIDGLPMQVIDTAGLRDSDDVVEKEGIKRAQHEIEQADIVLYVQDVTKPSQPVLPSLSAPIIYIHNKVDLTEQAPRLENTDGQTIVSLSAKTGDGLDLLKTKIKQVVGLQSREEGLYLARRRHLDALARANTHLVEADKRFEIPHSNEFVAEELRLAHLALSSITGAFTADDLLGEIFSSFCIGK